MQYIAICFVKRLVAIITHSLIVRGFLVTRKSTVETAVVAAVSPVSQQFSISGRGI